MAAVGGLAVFAPGVFWPEVDIYYAASRVFVCEAPIQDSHAILADVEVFKG